MCIRTTDTFWLYIFGYFGCPVYSISKHCIIYTGQCTLFHNILLPKAFYLLQVCSLLVIMVRLFKYYSSIHSVLRHFSSSLIFSSSKTPCFTPGPAIVVTLIKLVVTWNCISSCLLCLSNIWARFYFKHA